MSVYQGQTLALLSAIAEQTGRAARLDSGALTMTGTAIQALPAGGAGWLTITAAGTNAATIKIGNAAAQLDELSADSSRTIEAADLSLLYVRGNAGDKLTYITGRA